MALSPPLSHTYRWIAQSTPRICPVTVLAAHGCAMQRPPIPHLEDSEPSRLVPDLGIVGPRSLPPKTPQLRFVRVQRQARPLGVIASWGLRMGRNWYPCEGSTEGSYLQSAHCSPH